MQTQPAIFPWHVQISLVHMALAGSGYPLEQGSRASSADERKVSGQEQREGRGKRVISNNHRNSGN